MTANLYFFKDSLFQDVSVEPHYKIHYKKKLADLVEELVAVL